MTTDDFNICLSQMLAHTVEVLTSKSQQYATSTDKLHNFNSAAVLEHTTPIGALGGMMAKHSISVYDLIKAETVGTEISKDLWSEKITDSINYLYLLWALINDKKE